MEKLNSRQNRLVKEFRALSREAALRYERGLFVCDGLKLLDEALRSGAEVETVLWNGTREERFPAFREEALLDGALFDYVSPLKNSPGPLFTVRIRADGEGGRGNPQRVLVLEGVQDPGNVGTVLRTADAFGIDLVVLLDGCADVYAPKTVRAGMGAVFRQPVRRMTLAELPVFCREKGLPLYAAALSDRAADLRQIRLCPAAVCVGSEGKGLSGELKALCDGELIIPMCGAAESLNAAVAASVIMWEMRR